MKHHENPQVSFANLGHPHLLLCVCGLVMVMAMMAVVTRRGKCRS